jgi:tetratricopeptide (TPR) repeat protein
MVEPQLAKMGSFIAESFETTPVCVALMGSFTHERTKHSDIDIAVIFKDHDYDAHEERLVKSIPRIEEEVRRRTSRPAKVWTAKVDFFRIMLPDPQLVLANTPSTMKELDGWGGLAIRTFQNYFFATRKVIWGKDIEQVGNGGIPGWEAFELFLIATRVLGSAVYKIYIEGSVPQGEALIAKAILRAAYAHHILRGKAPLAGYSAIAEATADLYEERLRSMIRDALAVKLQLSDTRISLEDAVRFLCAIDEEFSEVPRLKIIGGTSFRKRGDRFACLIEESMKPHRRSWMFRGCLPSDNFTHALYFIRTAAFICEGLRNRSLPQAIYEFFAPEIVALLLMSGAGGGGGTMLVTGREDLYPIRWDPDLAQELIPNLETLLDCNWPETPFSVIGKENPATLRAVACFSAFTVSKKADGAEASKVWLKRGMSNGPSNWARGLESAAGWVFPLNPNNAWMHNMLGTSYLDAGLLREAGDHVQRCFELQDRHIENQRTVSMHFEEEGYQELARTCSHAGESIKEANMSLAQRLLGQCTAEGQPEIAVSALEAVRSIYPDKTDIIDMLADGYTSAGRQARVAGNLERGEEMYAKLLELNPENKKAYHNRGVLYDHFRQTEKAIRDYRRAIGIDSTYELPYIALSHLLQREGRIEESVDVCEEARSHGIETPPILVNLGNGYLHVGRYDDAERLHKMVLGLDADKIDRANSLNSLGLLSRRRYNSTQDKKFLATALKYFTEAYETDPSFEGARMNQIRTLMELSQKQESVGEEYYFDQSAPVTLTREQLHRDCTEQAAKFRDGMMIRDFFRCWFTFLRNVAALCPDWQAEYSMEFALETVTCYVQTAHSETARAEWQEVLQESLQDADLDEDLASLLRFFEAVLAGQGERARDYVRGHPLESILVSTILTSAER